jgi:hypothetical protein
MNSSYGHEMSGTRARSWESGRTAIATAIALPAQVNATPWREMVIVARETMMVVMIQVAFRAMLMLRRWNY